MGEDGNVTRHRGAGQGGFRGTRSLLWALALAAILVNGACSPGSTGRADVDRAISVEAGGEGLGHLDNAPQGDAEPARSPEGASPDTECHDRQKSYTSVVDTHLHFRPFGGPAIPFAEVIGYLKATDVRFVNVYGIGQSLPIDSPCTYYKNCRLTPVVPSIKNDFANAANYLEHKYFEPKPPRVHVTLSMTFPDLADPEAIVAGIKLLDKEYPGLFRWMGEVNLVKQALFENGHTATPQDAIQRWAPFMTILRERGIPITIHSDFGSDAEPTKYLYLMREVLRLYPENRIVWAHMGLSLELKAIDPGLHIATLRELLDRYRNLMLDISWKVLEDHYFREPAIRDRYVAFFNAYSDRILPGSDFVASGDKNLDKYRDDLEVSSRVNKHLSDEAFRNIALGQNYFRLLGLKEEAPRVCRTEVAGRAVVLPTTR